MSAARVQPIEIETAREDLQAVFARLATHYGGAVPIAHHVLARHPDLYRRWLGMGSQLLTAGGLDAKIRELAILRTATNTACAYEWRNHAPAARDAGATAVQLEALARPLPDPGVFTPAERAALDAADALWVRGSLDEGLWAEVEAAFGEAQAIELIFLVGHYVTTAFLVNALGVEGLEP